ncbi:MAG: homoserine O-acetyltransferase [Balneolaceae bacterium]|nr:homoserine O-acetyltransferase [Balneolaceae bacterium]
MSTIFFHTFKNPFITENGEQLSEPTIAYQTWGTLNEARDNVIVVCHALTGNTEANEWFGGFFGPGKTLDPDEHFIICTNALGSCYGTCGPVSVNPGTGKPYQADFSQITVRDIVRFDQLLLDELQIRGVEMVIGGSLGGMRALEFSIMDSRIKSAVLIAMGKAHSPWAIGISHTQREAIYNDPNWQEGYYAKSNPPKQGLALARKIAMNSYRSPQDFEAKFSRKRQQNSDQFQIESYLNYQGQKIVNRFDAVSYVRLTQAMDSHDIAYGRKGFRQALRKVKEPVLVIGIESDMLYPIAEQKELAQLLPNAHYIQIDSPHGHDGFLIEFDLMNQHILKFKKQLKNSIISH